MGGRLYDWSLPRSPYAPLFMSSAGASPGNHSHALAAPSRWVDQGSVAVGSQP